jgi:hypothetical protein
VAKKSKPLFQPGPDELPPDLKAKDCTYPRWTSKDTLQHEDRVKAGIADLHELQFYLVGGLKSKTQAGWVLTTLHISKPGRRSSQTSDRSYGITLDGKIVTVGKGPHVQKVVRVYSPRAT